VGLEKGGALLKELPPGLKIEYLGLQRRSPFSWYGVYRRVRTLLKKKRPGVVISFLTNVNLVVGLACRGLSLKLICSERISPDFYRSPGDWIRALVYCLYRIGLPCLYNHSHALVVQNNEIAMDWKKLGVFKEKVKGDNNWINGGFFVDAFQYMSRVLLI